MTTEPAPSRGPLATLRRAGLLEPGLVATTAGSLLWWGASLAAPYDAAALRHPFRTAIVDDYGSVRYKDLRRRSDQVAVALRGLGVRAGDQVGILCRNHRGFVEAVIGASKAGAVVIYLNTGFAPPQLAEVVDREGISVVVHDRDTESVVKRAALGATTVVAAPEDDPGWSFPDLARRRIPLLAPTVRRAAQPVLLTSGTTGTPKGARRSGQNVDAGAATGLLEAIPYRRNDTFVVPAPAFHAWGLSQIGLAAVMAGTVVLRRSFDAARVLDDVVAHRAQVLSVVPTMIRRMLTEQVSHPRDLSSLRVVASSGSALPGDLARQWMDAAGDTLYNLYGSTEVGQATVAMPADLRAAPGTAGRPLPGATVSVVGADDEPAPPEEVGRIFVGGAFGFDGYTGGGTKSRIGELMSIGDVGYFDADGRLFVTGRDDDMIVTGGENVFPAEIEDVLVRHPQVVEAAVIGVPDADLGLALEARVVAAPGETLRSDSLRKLVRDELARYKVPRKVVFVDELPRNATGKLLRRAIT